MCIYLYQGYHGNHCSTPGSQGYSSLIPRPRLGYSRTYKRTPHFNSESQVHNRIHPHSYRASHSLSSICGCAYITALEPKWSRSCQTHDSNKGSNVILISFQPGGDISLCRESHEHSILTRPGMHDCVE